MMQWLPAIVIFIYLAVVLYIGIFAFRRGKSTGEDFFLASRSVGGIVFFLSLFATNMTAFAIIGSSGMAYRVGIGVFGMMATSSALVIPLTLFFIGTRLWAIGKRFGHMTQVAFFRDRWECSEIGTFIFLLTAAMMLPYLIISIIGGGTILEALTDGRIPYAAGGAIVALVVMGNVFFGGMRGAVLVNVFQTLLFLAFGAIAVWAIGTKVNFHETVIAMLKNPMQAPLWSRAPGKDPGSPPGVPMLVFVSYMLIPLSSIMFPHMAIMCFTAKKVQAFKKTVVLYPICIMLIWLPCVFLGALAMGQPKVNAAMAGGSETMQHWMAHPDRATEPALIKAVAKVRGGKAFESELLQASSPLTPNAFAEKLFQIVKPLSDVEKKPIVQQIGLLAKGNSESVLLQTLKLNVAPLLAGFLAAGIISAVMGSDCHQILALSTMFTQDIIRYYGGHNRLGERGTVAVGRTFIVVANVVAYTIALFRPPIFEFAVQYAFSGFASLAPVMVAALFWKRSTRWGAFLASLFVAICVVAMAYLELHYRPAKPVFPPVDIHIWEGFGSPWALFLNKQYQLRVFGLLPVVPMVIGSTIMVIIGSLLTAPPSQATIQRYFPARSTKAGELPVVATA